MFKWLFVLPILLVFTGCGRTLSEEAVYQARIAIESGDYERGSLKLVMGCEDLHEQSVYLLHMIDYRNSNDLLGMVYAWIEIYGIDASADFVQEAAYQILNTTLDNVIIVDRQ
jgi:hypothetical protein